LSIRKRQAFLPGRDIPEQWWALFKSPRLNALIVQALHNNQNLQSALGSLRAAKEAVYAQEGKFFPLAQTNFNPTRQRTSAALTPLPANGAQIFNLVTVQAAPIRRHSPQFHLNRA
jgi:outer membrane protein TolC